MEIKPFMPHFPKQTKMQKGSCKLLLTPNNHVFKTVVTPAEVQMLRGLHHKNAGTDPVVDLKVDSDDMPSSYDDHMELQRLTQIYGYESGSNKPKVSLFFPGVNPKLPQTFKEVEFLKTQDSSKTPSGRIFLPGQPGFEEQAEVQAADDKRNEGDETSVVKEPTEEI